jgi:hypothetical protein
MSYQDPITGVGTEHTGAAPSHSTAPEVGKEHQAAEFGKHSEDTTKYAVGGGDELGAAPSSDHRAETKAEELAVSDAEKGSFGHGSSDSEERERNGFAFYYNRYKVFVHLFIWLFFTG